MKIDHVNVKVSGEFGKEGEAAKNITYRVDLQSTSHNHEQIKDLIRYVDEVAEIHATIRGGSAIKLVE
jgi:hypothetical protein